MFYVSYISIKLENKKDAPLNDQFIPQFSMFTSLTVQAGNEPYIIKTNSTGQFASTHSGAGLWIEILAPLLCDPEQVT